jgi:hypothetical protein
MRHSDPSLTANVYTDTAQLDIAKAIDRLPALPLCGVPNGVPATGYHRTSLSLTDIQPPPDQRALKTKKPAKTRA